MEERTLDNLDREENREVPAQLSTEERRAMKRRARKRLKHHYGLLLIITLIAVLIGSEYSSNALFLHLADEDTLLSHERTAEMVINFNDPGAQVLKDILKGNVIEGIQLSDELQEQFATSGTAVLGHTEGVLASAVNMVTSGHLYIKVLQSIFTITRSPKATIVIFVVLGILLYALFFALIREPYVVILRRMFLEAGTYEKVPFHHFFHLKHSQRWIRASKTIILKDCFYGLWFLTIAGAVIKRYSYYMVPYIVAENPDVRPREAIDLSRRMMDGHKWECFKYEMTFIHWILLGYLTGGFVGVFFYVPYKLAVNSEYYARIRQQAIDARIEGWELLDDEYLFAHAEKDLLRYTYRDIEEEQRYLNENEVPLVGIQKFFAENLGIWIGSSEAKKEYQRIKNRSFDLARSLDVVAGLAYPDRLDPRYRNEALVERIQTDFLRCYTIWNLLFMFFLFAFIGWLWEVILFAIQTGEFVNRGSLYGPWIPIYGVGGTLILVVVCRLRTRPLLEFFSIAAVSGTVEFFTSWFMEKETGMRWWDYSGYFLNLDGRICAEGLFAFAVLGSAVVYFLAPQIDSMLMRINHRIIFAVTVILAALFTADVIFAHIHPHTGKGITDMGAASVTAQVTPPMQPASAGDRAAGEAGL